MERWRAFFAKANADIWTVIEQAINVAATDHPEVFREKRGDIAETLFARRLLHVVPGQDEAVSLGFLDDEHPTSAMEEGELKDDAEETVLATVCLEKEETYRLNPCYDEAELLQDGVLDQETASIEEINRIKEAIRDDNQEENVLLGLLQKLENMQITVHALKVTEIGKEVNFLRKHPSKHVRVVAKQLVKHWKFIVDEWVKKDADGVKVAAGSPIASAGLLSRKEPEDVKRLQVPASSLAENASTVPPEKSASGELAQLFSFIDEEDICGQNKQSPMINMDHLEDSLKGSAQDSSRSHSGSAITYSSDFDVRIGYSQAWGLQTPGEVGSATRDNHTSERIEKLLEPVSTALLMKNEMAHREAYRMSTSQPPAKVSVKTINPSKCGTDPSKSRGTSDAAGARGPAVDHLQKSQNAQKASATHGSGSVRNVKPSMPNVKRHLDWHVALVSLKLLDKSQVDQKFEIAKRKLHEGYQLAENAKKQRTVQVLAFPDLPKNTQARGKMNTAVPSKGGSLAGLTQTKRHG